MCVEFHCEHCNKLVRMAGSDAGRIGTCPHCEGTTYIPAAESGELPLVPLDEAEERRRKEAARRDAGFQRSLWHEQTRRDRESTRTLHSGAKRSAANLPKLATKDVNLLIVNYTEAMSAGQLGRADEIAKKLARYKSQAIAALDAMTAENLTAYGLPNLPRPVLLGFLRHLRSRL